MNIREMSEKSGRPKMYVGLLFIGVAVLTIAGLNTLANWIIQFLP